MRALRKDYTPLTDGYVDRLRADAFPLVAAVTQMILPAQTVYALTMELTDLREEVFRLQLCSTVDQILSEELDDDDEEDLLAFRWPDDYTFGGDALPYGGYIPAEDPSATLRLDTAQYPNLIEPNPDQEGRRLPRAD